MFKKRVSNCIDLMARSRSLILTRLFIFFSQPSLWVFRAVGLKAKDDARICIFVENLNEIVYVVAIIGVQICCKTRKEL